MTEEDLTEDGRFIETWEMTVDEFIGPAVISDSFTIDGRADMDYEPLWDAVSPHDPETGERVLNDDALRWPVWRDAAGYTIREIADEDFQPEGVMILVAPDRQPCGFYMDGQCWVDPAHRGRGLAIPLILAAAERLGGSPTNNGEGLGFSPAGHAAHIAAHRQAVETALADGFPVPDAVLADHSMTRPPPISLPVQEIAP